MSRPSIGMLDWYLGKYILSCPDLQTTMGHTDDTTAVHIDDCTCFLDMGYIDFETDPLQLKNFQARMDVVCPPDFLQDSNDQLDR